MEWKLNDGNKTLNFEKMQNLYVREKKVGDVYTIDKIAVTNWPRLKKLKHYIVGVFTNYKYVEGNNALKEINKSNIVHAKESNFYINTTDSNGKPVPFNGPISLHIYPAEEGKDDFDFDREDFV